MSPIVLRDINPRIFTPPQFQDADSEDVVIEDSDSEDGIEPDWPTTGNMPPPATQDMTDTQDLFQDTPPATQDVPYSQDLFQDTPPASQDVTDAEDI